MNAWDRLPDEPSLWHHRLMTYTRLGVDRTMLAAYREDRRRRKVKDPDAVRCVPQPWTRAARRWDWKERAMLWDDAERLKITQREAQLREEDRTYRIQMLRAYRSRVIQAISTLEPSSATFKDVNAAIAMINREIRMEYGDLPGIRTDTVVTSPDGTSVMRSVENIWIDLDAPILTETERRAANELARVRVEEQVHRRRSGTADDEDDDAQESTRDTA